ncbi:MAG: hypothetical protein MUC83_08390 [Pirellula sp.]|jgi:hypothetical protein|nr:hypothetical protein [Pirellula sp.]
MKLPITKLHARIATACLSLLFLSVVSSTSYGQLPNQSKSSPLNYLARFHGLGYSDGYHACPNNQCPPRRSWAGAASFSSFYGEPTTPSAGRFQKPAPSYSAHQVDYSSAIPSHSILLHDEPSTNAPSESTYPAYPDQRGTISGEMLPPPQPVRTPNQSRRPIPGSTRPYQANLPSNNGNTMGR